MPTAAKQTEVGFTKTLLEYAAARSWRTAHFRPGRKKCHGCRGQLCTRCDGSGWTFATAVAGQGKGFPDLVLVRRDRLIVAELKMPGNNPTPEQEEWLLSFEKTCAEVYVWRPSDWPDIEDVLE